MAGKFMEELAWMLWNRMSLLPLLKRKLRCKFRDENASRDTNPSAAPLAERLA